MAGTREQGKVVGSMALLAWEANPFCAAREAATAAGGAATYRE
jgi:hypothetical protein